MFVVLLLKQLLTGQFHGVANFKSFTQILKAFFPLVKAASCLVQAKSETEPTALESLKGLLNLPNLQFK